MLFVLLVVVVLGLHPERALLTCSLGVTHNNSLGPLWQCDFLLYILREETYVPTDGRYHRDENKGSYSTMYKFRGSGCIFWWLYYYWSRRYKHQLLQISEGSAV
jgi:hypothetical protein